MKIRTGLVALFMVMTSAAMPAAAPAVAHEGHVHTQGTGTLNAVDAAAHKVNISHKAIPELGWPAMRMDFPVADTVDLKALQAGGQIEFVLEKNKAGTYEVQSIKPVGAK